MGSKKSEVLVVAHDAGAGELIAAYVRDHSTESTFHIYAAGPAAKIFRREGIASQAVQDSRESVATILERHAHVAYALLGTGWMTQIELTSLAIAKECGIKTVVYLDSWKDYRVAFGYPNKDWKKNIPDELWVGDAPARALAKKQFPKTRLRLVPNGYFANVVARYKRTQKKTPGNRILFLSTPLPVVHDICADLVADLAKIHDAPELIIRPHPADVPHRYDDLMKKYRAKLHMKVSSHKDIVKDLVRVRAVLGTETVGLVVSVLCGIKTIRIVKGKQKMILPYPQIKVVHSTNAALHVL